MRDYIRERLILKLGITKNGSRTVHLPCNNFQNQSESSKNKNNSKSNDSTDSFSFKLLDLSQSDSSRLKYLRRLSYLKVWVPSIHRAPKHQTAIIFDWDDTLLCTSYLNSMSISNNSNYEKNKDLINSSARGLLEKNLMDDKNNVGTKEFKVKKNVCDDSEVSSTKQSLFSEELQTSLNLIQKCVLELLEKSLELGHVFLITNASEDWVNYSANLYLPEVIHVLSKLTVISARSKYEQKFPGAYHKWKFHAFLEIQKKLNSETITNLISIGDSIIEMEAVHILGREFSESLVKTIKMKESPSPDELYKQLTLINSKFENICLNARNLKIVLEKRVF